MYVQYFNGETGVWINNTFNIFYYLIILAL